MFIVSNFLVMMTLYPIIQESFMNIALIGASGFIGSAILQEALSRGHQVTALVTNPAKLAAQDRLTISKADVLQQDALGRQLKGFDLVISAFSGHAQSDTYDYYMKGITAIIGAVKDAGVPRFIVVGGAGSLQVAPGVDVKDTEGFPPQFKATAEGARQALKLLRTETTLNWTMLSPAAHIAPGERTGKFRLGTDQLLVDARGESHISVQDYAVALLDEAQAPAHARSRFTLAY
jgi:hypothetical protein